MAHKTNYKDALFEQRKYRMQNNPDGTVTPIDETDYTQEGDRIGALELNEIGEALNALEQEISKEKFQMYTTLSQLSLVAPATMSQLITAMPDGSYAAIECNGTSVVSDIPSGSAAGLLEVVKVGNSGSVKYTNTSDGQIYFRGDGQWYKAIVAEMVLDTMEEVNANNNAGIPAGAKAVKELSGDLVARIEALEQSSGVVYVGTYGTDHNGIDVSTLVADRDVTSANFFLVTESFSANQNTVGVHNDSITNGSVNYNAQAKTIDIVVPKWRAVDTTTHATTGSANGTVRCYLSRQPLPDN